MYSKKTHRKIVQIMERVKKMTAKEMETTIKALAIRINLLESEIEERESENEKLIRIIDDLNTVIYSMGKRESE